MYKCICGLEFDNPQKFNGHKQGCKIHITNKYGSWEKYLIIKNRGHSHIYSKIRAKNIKKKETELNKWISEQHTCERCGKVMTEKFGSGRFCSRSCANTREHSQETKNNISKSIKVKTQESTYKNNSALKAEEKYKLSPRKCVICGKELSYENRRRSTCSEKCLNQLFSNNAKAKNFGGPSTNSSYGKRGIYKGIHCDSTYELAFLIYCIDKNIKIKRNADYFEYSYNNKRYKYYPDFYLDDHALYIEIKGRDIGPVLEKLKGVEEAGKKIKILYYDDLLECFKYVCETYNVHHTKYSSNMHTLYD